MTRSAPLAPPLLVAALATLLSLGFVACGGDEPRRPRPDASVETDGGEDGGQDAGPDVDPDPDGGTPDAGPPPELKILEVLPPRAPSAGNVQVLLKGQGFIRGFAQRGTEAKLQTTVKFAQNPSQDLQIIDDETMDVRVPPGKAGLTNITIENPNGLFVCQGCFTFFDQLVLGSATPREGPLRGGTVVTLEGEGFTPDVQVNFGKLSSPQVTFVSATKLEVVAPRGLGLGQVDVTVYNKNGVGTLRRHYRYVADLRVTQATPLTGPLGGGTTVQLSGQGFEPGTTVRFGGVPASSVTVVDGTVLTAVTPPGTAAGAVDVSLETPLDTWTERNAFTYVSGSGDALHGVYPHVGPSTGNNVVALTGEGLDAAGLAVSIGGQAASFTVESPNLLRVSVPAQSVSSPPKVDVVVTRPSSPTRTLAGGYTYRVNPTGLLPASGPSTGGTTATLSGTNFPATLEVYVGARAATAVQPNASGVSLLTPPGSGGAPVDVWVRDAADPENETVLPGAFTFEEPLSVGRVQPDRGAIAGGTLVTVLGAGFGEGTTVDFGSERAKDVKIVDPHTLTCRTPRGDVGQVDIKVRRSGQTDTLPGGFAYYDPRSISGGVSGGPLTGTLNVTVLDSTQGFFGAPVPLAQVMLGTDTTTPLQGITDARGQLTFSDPSLVKAQLVTVWKDGYESVSVSSVASENLTVFVARTGGDGSPGNPPPGVPPSIISGRVTGFKAPRKLGPSEVLEARVFVAQVSMQQGPPFRGPPNRQGQKWQLLQDGAEYTVVTTAGLRAVYAILGVKDTVAGTFTPHLMGVKRGITVSPEKPAQQQDIVLDMHLDRTVPVTVDGPLSILGTPAFNGLYAWLDLGAEGFIPNPANWLSGLGASTSVGGTGTSFQFPYFPQLDGSNFIFLTQTEGPQFYPVSYFYRRQPGDLTKGVTIGPLLPPPEVLEPTASTGFTGTIRWVTQPGPQPDIQQVLVLKPTPFGSVTLWSMVVPGAQTQLSLPPPAVEKLEREEAGGTLFIAFFTSRSPKFSYNQWTYDALSGQSWSSYTIALSDGFIP